MGGANDELVQNEQQRKRHHENDPAFRFVKKAFGQIRIEAGEDAGERDAARVSCDRNRDRRKEQYDPNPCTLLEEVTVDQREEGQREPVSYTHLTLPTIYSV